MSTTRKTADNTCIPQFDFARLAITTSEVLKDIVPLLILSSDSDNQIGEQTREQLQRLTSCFVHAAEFNAIAIRHLSGGVTLFHRILANWAQTDYDAKLKLGALNNVSESILLARANTLDSQAPYDEVGHGFQSTNGDHGSRHSKSSTDIRWVFSQQVWARTNTTSPFHVVLSVTLEHNYDISMDVLVEIAQRRCLSEAS